MTTFTLNRNMDANDCLFVALNDSCYADWKASQDMWDESDRVVISESLVSRIRKFFAAR